MFKKTTLVMLMFAASALSAAEPVPLPEAYFQWCDDHDCPYDPH